MYHKSMFGSINLPSDINGYVGEHGDKFEDFEFDLEGDLDNPEDYDYYVNEWFPGWIEGCVVARESAERELAKFRNQ